MAKSPVRVDRVNDGNGGRKTIVREREYDLRSWNGIKTLASVVMAIGAVIVAVLTAYYTAEASQDSAIAQQAQAAAIQKQRLDDNEEGLKAAFKKFDTTLGEQRKVMDDTKETVIRIDTRQQVLIERVEKISDKLDKVQ